MTGMPARWQALRGLHPTPRGHQSPAHRTPGYCAGSARLGDRPDMVILALGANDGLRAVNPEVTRSNLAAMLEQLRSKKLPVLLAGIYAPPNLGRDYASPFNRIYPELASQYDALLYPFFLEGVATRPELNQADGLHPNAEGVAVIVQRMTPYIVKLIELSRKSLSGS